MQQRYHSLDFLRAVMMLLGIVLHGAQMYMAQISTTDYYLDPMRSMSMDAVLIIINTFRMPIFFFLSGFFIALLLDKRGMAGMLENRLKRIALPFLVLLPPLGLIMGILTILGANWLQTRTIGLDISYIDNPIRLVDKTHNLWFLYYLTMHFLTASALVTVYSMWVQESGKDFTIASSTKHLITAIVIMSVLLGIIGSLNVTGRINAKVSFVPSIKVYLYFGIIFIFGWGLYYAQWMITTFRNHCWKLMLLAWLTLIAGFAGFTLQGKPSSENYTQYHTLLALMNGFSVTFFIAAFVGIFQRYFNEFNTRYRYLSDSAYWVFCSHSIFLVALAIPMAHLNWPAEIKFFIVVVGATYFCFVSYKYMVRSTWVGQLLNGKKY